MTDAVEVEPFFAKEENLEKLKQLHQLLINNKEHEDFSIAGMKGWLIIWIDLLIKERVFFDKKCSFFVKKYQDYFKEVIDECIINYNKNSDSEFPFQNLASLFYVLMSDLIILGQASLGIFGGKVRNFLIFIESNLSKFHRDAVSSIAYVRYKMLSEFIDGFVNHQNIEILKELNENIKNVDGIKKSVDELSKKLEEQKYGFNFVGLVKAFENMKTIKEKEKLWTFVGLIGCGFLMVAPIITELSYLWQNKDNLVNVEKLVFYAAIPSITLEVILVYFFRVVLAQYRSIKAQLLQLELRAALCQFIEKYAEFAAKTTEAKAPISEKFESLIFSGILANEDQIPSTFDGVEQFAKLIDALKSKGGK